MRDAKADILKFWFEEVKPSQWFQKNPDFDDDVRARFEGDYHLAAAGIYDAWLDNAKACLALIILLDQFPRNMYRGRPQMFATDHKALAVARHAVDKHYDQMMGVDERAFIYLPFEHSEDMADQETSLRLFETLKSDNPVYYDYARRHYDVVKKFGRFPYRNAILERQNTLSEEDYMAQADSGF